MLKDALLYGNFGWRVFPITPNTKIPYAGTNGFKDAKSRSDDLEELFKNKDGCNIAVATGKVSEIFVIDIDNKDLGKGSLSLEALEIQYGKLPVTVSAQTPTSGRHLYFKRPINIKIPCNTGRLGLGIDIRGDGGYIILPPSTIDGKEYVWEAGCSPFEIPIADAPQWLLKLLNAKHDRDFIIDLSDKDKIIKEHDPGRNDRLFDISCVARNMGLKDYHSLFAFLQGVNLHCCRPPKSENEVQTICNSSLRYEDQRAEVIVDEHTETAPAPEIVLWDRKDNGKLVSSYRNILNIFKTEKKLGTFKFNEFSHQVIFIEKPFWLNTWHGEKVLDDNDMFQIKQYLSSEYDLQPSVNTIYEAIQTVSFNRKFHPIRNYLKSLEWDKVNRIENFLTNYLGASNDELTKFISKMLFCAAVKRVYHPGCKYDYMIILEGKQGIGKSMALRALGGEWFGEVSLTDRDRDTIDKIQGKWIIEVPELQVFQTKEIESLKSFLSTQSDRTRLAYARCTKEFPRQNVFIGTINPDTLGYLRDMTGNRRFLPISCGKILVDEISRDKDKFFAEAVHYVEKGFKIFLPQELELLAEEEQAKRLISEPWLQYIMDWINDPLSHANDDILISDVWKHALNGAPERLTRRENLRIAHVLMSLGYECQVKRVNGKVSRVYSKKEEEVNWE